MAKERKPAWQSDRWSYLWLAVGVVLLALSMGRFRVALAAWLAPVFLLRFVRTQRTGRAYWVILLGLYVAYVVSWPSILVPDTGWPAFLVFAIAIAVQNSLPLLADRLLAPRLPGFAATLVYPLAVTASFVLNNLVSPLGSFGTVGYEQYHNLALVQLVSVTGLWGLTFLVSWLGPVANWAWERAFGWREIRRGLAIWAGVMAAVLIFGGLRLAFSDLEPGMVEVHGFEPETIVDPPDWKTEREAFRRATQEEHQRFIDGTIRHAEQGARIVLWPERAGVGIDEDIDQLIARVQEVARQEEIYVAMALDVKFPDQDRLTENKLVVIAPSGEVVIDHDKYGATLLYALATGEAVLQGDDAVQTADTPYGGLSGVVCWDADFPSIVKQAGRQGTDILFVAAGDPEGPVGRLHMQQAVFRAVENGFSLVRQETQAGISVAADPYGRVLAMVDLNAGAKPAMAVQVPTQGAFTLYPIIGDLIGWLSMAGLAGMIVWAIVARRRV